MVKRKLSDDGQTTGEDGSEYGEFVHKWPKKVHRQKSTAALKTRDNGPDDDGRLSKDQEQHPLSRHVIDSSTLICSALLDWYAGVCESRGMPWRKPYDLALGPDGRAQRAYEVWVSEIMLQQTQVATVIPYYNRWMEKFPTIKDLAASDIEAVNGLWKGLGYYSRAARLLSGAQQVVKKLGGRLPDNAKDMKDKIPGIGRYSAGAICSIAYNQRVPVLDGNVHRLLSRILALHAPPKAKATLDILWSAATALVESTDHPGDLNQSLIELGSVLCKVRDPACAVCPVQSWCKAYQSSKAKDLKRPSQTFEVPDIEELCTICDPLPNGLSVTTFPMKAERKKAREELDVVNVVEWRCGETGDRWFLLVRRPEDGLLAGLYEFPTLTNVSSTTASELTKMPHTLLSTLLLTPPQAYSKRVSNIPSNSISDTNVDNPVRITKIESAGDVLHVFSHIRKTYRLQWVVMEGGGVYPPALRTAGFQSGETQNSRKTKAAAKSRVKGKGKRNTENDSSSIPSHLRWIPIQDVTDANIGTGVLKVWDQVKTLWEVTLTPR